MAHNKITTKISEEQEDNLFLERPNFITQNKLRKDVEEVENMRIIVREIKDAWTHDLPSREEDILQIFEDKDEEWLEMFSKVLDAGLMVICQKDKNNYTFKPRLHSYQRIRNSLEKLLEKFDNREILVYKKRLLKGIPSSDWNKVRIVNTVWFRADGNWDWNPREEGLAYKIEQSNNLIVDGKFKNQDILNQFKDLVDTEKELKTITGSKKIKDLTIDDELITNKWWGNQIMYVLLESDKFFDRDGEWETLQSENALIFLQSILASDEMVDTFTYEKFTRERKKELEELILQNIDNQEKAITPKVISQNLTCVVYKDGFEEAYYPIYEGEIIEEDIEVVNVIETPPKDYN